MLRTFVNRAALHHARAHLLSEAWCRDYDGAVVTHVEGLLGQTLAEDARAQAYLSQKHGGLGFQSMQDRRLGAYVGSWYACLHEVCCEVGATTLRSFTDACPQTSHSVCAASVQAGEGPDALLKVTAEAQAGVQKRLVKARTVWKRNVLLNALPPEQAAQLRSASGAGAGSWLLPPTGPENQLANPHFLTAVALRLRLPPPPGSSGSCSHRRPGGQPCGVDLCADPAHPLVCPVGGSTCVRHDAVRDWLAAWLKARGAAGVATEQWVPAWDRPRRDGYGVEAARLDVAFADPVGGMLYIDVSDTSAACGAGTPEGRNRATRNGAAAAAMEERKHRRYPGGGLVPFVLEAHGRLGLEAQSLLRRWAADDADLCAARQALAATLQRANADAYVSAVRPFTASFRAARAGA